MFCVLSELWRFLISYVLRNVFQGGSNTCTDRTRAAQTPKVHEEEPRLFGEHVTVECGHQNMVRLEFRYYRIHFFRGQHEIARRCDVTGICCLEIYALSHAGGR